jgi:hypothetical protein
MGVYIGYRGGARVGRVREAGRGGIKPSRCGESKRRRWSVVSMGSGMVTEECSGASRSCTVFRRDW